MPDGVFEMAGLEGELVAHVPPSGKVAATAKLDVETFSLSKGASTNGTGNDLKETTNGEKE